MSRLSITAISSSSIRMDESLDVELPKAPSSHESNSFLYNEAANKFINCMMWDGKKLLSQNIFRKALGIIKQEQLAKYHDAKDKSQVETDPLNVFLKALENAAPVIGTIGIKRGGRTYQVPVPLTPNRRRFLSMKWIIVAAREGNTKKLRMPERLASEILDAFNNRGSVIKKKQDVHRVAESNRAYAHYRWSWDRD